MRKFYKVLLDGQVTAVLWLEGTNYAIAPTGRILDLEELKTIFLRLQATDETFKKASDLLHGNVEVTLEPAPGRLTRRQILTVYLWDKAPNSGLIKRKKYARFGVTSALKPELYRHSNDYYLLAVINAYAFTLLDFEPIEALTVSTTTPEELEKEYGIRIPSKWLTEDD